MNRLADTGATVVANIPEQNAVAALTPAEEIAEAVGLPISVIEAIRGIGPDDLVTPQGIALISAILANPSLGPLPANVVLMNAGASQIRGTTERRNLPGRDQ